MRERLSASWRTARELVEATAASSAEDSVPTLAAAISYWLLVTIAPLLVAVNAVGQFVLRPGSAVAQVTGLETTQTVPIDASDLYGSAVSWAGPYATWIALGLVLVGATAVFGQFVGAVARIWNEPTERGPIYHWIRSHLLAFALLFVATAALVASAVTGAVAARLGGVLEEAATTLGLVVPDVSALLSSRLLLSFLAAALLFTIALVVIPLRRPSVRDVLPGAIVTAAAYVLGEAVLSVYLGSTSRFDALGVFGVFVAFLVWIYYTALIVLYGTELTHEIVIRRETARATSS